MKQVYILTEKGKEYTKEGCLYVEKKIRENFNETEDLIYSQGALFNDTTYMVESLKNHLDENTAICCYIVVSYKDGMNIFPGTAETISNFEKDVQTHPSETSWQIFLGESTPPAN